MRFKAAWHILTLMATALPVAVFFHEVTIFIVMSTVIMESFAELRIKLILAGYIMEIKFKTNHRKQVKPLLTSKSANPAFFLLLLSLLDLSDIK